MVQSENGRLEKKEVVEEKVIESQPRGLVQRLEDMEGLLEKALFKKDKKNKKFQLPFSIRKGFKQKLKKGYCLVFLVKLNGELVINLYPLNHNVINIPVNNTYHVATPNYILRYKKYPVLILPEWNLLPFSPSENFEKAQDDGTLSITEKVLMDLMHQLQAGTLKSKLMGGKMILFAMIAIAAGLYFLSQIITGGTG